MPNDLIITSRNSANQLMVKARIQFIIDLNMFRSLKYQGTDVSNMKTFASKLYNELAKCWNFTCTKCQADIGIIDPSFVPYPNDLFRFWRPHQPPADPYVPNPFQPGAAPFTDTYPFFNPSNQPVLPLVRFYVGDGESLHSDILGAATDKLITSDDADDRYEKNFSDGFVDIIPAYRHEYSTRTSFFNPYLRAGYLFTDSDNPMEGVFQHELGHVFGLSDRYIEGIDEAAPGDGIFSLVGPPARTGVPLSVQHIDSVLNPVHDTTYNPQDNLMSSRSYALSDYQRTLIETRQLEPDYVDDDVMVLLSLNAACREVTPPAATTSPGCLSTPTPYRPSTVTLVSGKQQVIYQTGPTTVGKHNAFFRTAPDPDGRIIEYRGDKKVLNKLQAVKLLNYGPKTKAMIYRYLKK